MWRSSEIQHQFLISLQRICPFRTSLRLKGEILFLSHYLCLKNQLHRSKGRRVRRLLLPKIRENSSPKLGEHRGSLALPFRFASRLSPTCRLDISSLKRIPCCSFPQLGRIWASYSIQTDSWCMRAWVSFLFARGRIRLLFCGFERGSTGNVNLFLRFLSIWDNLRQVPYSGVLPCHALGPWFSVRPSYCKSFPSLGVE